jgi:hypothetical protein
MDNTTLFNSKKGSIIISILLGFALASLLCHFKCSNNCIIHELKDNNLDKIYNYNNKCYKFNKIYI